MHKRVLQYIINVLYLVHISATHVAILKEALCKRWIHRYSTRFVKQGTDVKYYILKILGLKYILKSLNMRLWNI
jgi:hypothetical protein